MPAALLLAFRARGVDDDLAARFASVSAAFPDRVRAMEADDVREADVLLRTWSHAAAVGSGITREPGRGGWAAVLGNPMGPGLAGAGPAAVGDRVLAAGAAGLDALSAPFAVALREATSGPVVVAVDPCGLQHLYLREAGDGTVWVSSSALALAAALGATLDHDAVAEWLAAGHFVSERTLFRETRKVGAGERLQLGATVLARRAPWPPTPAPAGQDGDYRAALLAAIGDRHHEAQTAAELTGGLDSRLVLAGRLAAGTPTLSWTMGDPRSAELQTVERLRRVAGFEHVLAPVQPGGLRPADLTLQMHALSDGEVNALEYAPLLAAFAHVDGRWRVSLSGAGGETGRGYYYAALHDGHVDTAALARKFAGATAGALGTLPAERFADRLAPLRGVLETFLDASPLPTPANRLEDLYLRTRMQRFAGRNTTTTGYFFRQALPFFDNAVIAACFALGEDRKADGAVMRDAIRAWAPPLAAVPLDSGMSMTARSWRHPGTQARWAASMGRKAAARYGGAPGRRVAARPAVPWAAIGADRGLRELVLGTLRGPDTQVDGVLDRGAVDALIERGLAGRDLYALGLVLTLELTLRRAAGR